MTMLERIARAIDPGAWRPEDHLFPYWMEQAQTKARKRALAAVEAMLGAATDEMLDAGGHIHHRYENWQEQRRTIAGQIFDAMLKAILATQPQEQER